MDALTRKVRVAYLGPEGTFTQQAMLEYFGAEIEPSPCRSIPEIFAAVEASLGPSPNPLACDYGVVPVENSGEGSVTRTLDLFLDSPLKVEAELMLGIHHFLLSRAASLDGITEIFAHQQALAQCQNWLERRFPLARKIPVSSNAEGARLASIAIPSTSGAYETAAIAGVHAAQLYGLNVLENQIEDEKDNTTRFWIIGSKAAPRTGRDRTSFLITLKNRPGVLFETLEPLARHRIDMTKIESRPSRKGRWDYVFFIDIAGHIDDPNISQALNELKACAANLIVLGSYPRADEV